MTWHFLGGRSLLDSGPGNCCHFLWGFTKRLHLFDLCFLLCHEEVRLRSYLVVPCGPHLVCRHFCLPYRALWRDFNLMPLGTICRPPVGHIPCHSLMDTPGSPLWKPRSRPCATSGQSQRRRCFIRTLEALRTSLSRSPIPQSCLRSCSLPGCWLPTFQVGMKGRLSGKMALVSWPWSPRIWSWLTCWSSIFSLRALDNCDQPAQGPRRFRFYPC